MKLEYQTVLLASLLHDIGKFMQRSDFAGSLKITGRHPEVSADFIRSKMKYFDGVADPDMLTELVKRHHESEYFPPELRVQGAPGDVRHLAYLVSRADNYSSSERGERQARGKDYKTVPLASVFSSLRLKKPAPEVMKYKLHPLNPATAFPEQFDRLNPEQTNKHLRRFGQEFDGIFSSLDLNDFDLLFTHLISLLQRYTWCVPSNTMEEVPDISLYDHLRTTCAIASCLYIYHAENSSFNIPAITDDKREKFCLLVGDLSGIQGYIFDIANIGVGGVAKRLRARSFYLTALLESLCHNILHRFSLPLTNVIMSSGGKFYILLPNTDNVEERIDAMQQDLDCWFARQYHGELVVNLARTKLNGQSFGSFGEVLSSLSDRLNLRKSGPLKEHLVRNNSWAPENFLMDKMSGAGNGLCQSCRKFLAEAANEEGYELCRACLQDKLLGARLANAGYIAYGRGAVPAGGLWEPVFSLYDGYWLTVMKDAPEKGFPAYLVQKIGDTTLEELKHHPAQFKFLANYIPLAEEDSCQDCVDCNEPHKPRAGEPLYFDCIANRSGGKKLLGYLKADVDNLGSLFVYGLKDDLQDRGSISRLATLSRMLDTFFSGRIEQLLDTEYTNCYSVFSGGDDLLVIGPWDQAIGLAVSIQDEFKKFTCHNPNITLSAGLAFTKPKAPLSRAVANAEDQLEKSKETKLIGEDGGRNQLTLLGSTIKWEKVVDILEAAKKLSEWLKRDYITAGFVRKLMTFADMHRGYYQKGDSRGLRYIPLLTYDITRNFKPLTGDSDTSEREVRQWVECLKHIDHAHTIYLKLLTSYALLSKEG